MALYSNKAQYELRAISCLRDQQFQKRSRQDYSAGMGVSANLKTARGIAVFSMKIPDGVAIRARSDDRKSSATATWKLSPSRCGGNIKPCQRNAIEGWFRVIWCHPTGSGGCTSSGQTFASVWNLFSVRVRPDRNPSVLPVRNPY